MNRPSRTRRILKWTGAVLSALILAAWLACGWWKFAAPIRDDLVVYLRPGAMDVMFADFNYVKVYAVVPVVRRHDWAGLGFTLPHVYNQHPFGTRYWCIVPFWLVLLLTTFPTAWLWQRDRRRIQPGCCLRCEYDLTGNVSGKCSECGAKFQPGPAPDRM